MKKSSRKSVAKRAKSRQNAPSRASVPAVVQQAPPLTWQERAIDRGMTAEQITAIAKEMERQDAIRARVEFDRAWSACQQELPVVPRTREVDFPSKSGGDPVNYWYAPYSTIVATLRPILSKYGLGFLQKVTNNDGSVTVSTGLMGFGHREEPSTLTGKNDTSGAKNPIQGMGSTQSYLQRYTLLAALGLATADDDDATSFSAGPPVSVEQADEINRKLAELRPLDGDYERRMFQYVSRKYQRTIESVDEIPAEEYGDTLYYISERMRKLNVAPQA